MKTFLAVLLSATVAAGQDAPLADPPIEGLPPRGRVLEIEGGTIVPFDATCLDQQQALRASKLSAYYRDEALDLKKGNVVLPTPAFVAIVSGGVVAVVVAVIATAYAAKK